VRRLAVVRLAELSGLLAVILYPLAPQRATAQAPRAVLPIEFEHSAEFAWLRKPILASRALDDMRRADTWRMTGTGSVTFPAEPRLGGERD
jgi:hypothetical protein